MNGTDVLWLLVAVFSVWLIWDYDESDGNTSGIFLGVVLLGFSFIYLWNR